MPKINSVFLRKFIDKLDPNRRLLSKVKSALRQPAYQKLSYPCIDSSTFELLLSHVINIKAPFCCGKIGAIESHLCQSLIRSWARNDLFLPRRARKDALINAGINPNNYVSLSSFCQLYTNSISQADVVQVWFQAGELEVIHSASCLNPPFLAPLISLEPYYGHSNRPWTHSLENKKVLIVSPFAESISRQYLNRINIWPSGLLPDFTLKVLRFPHSPISDSSVSTDYFNRISYFKELISNIDFDVLIAGCGAAAFPLAAFAKQLNKVGIAMGGSLQILFGIRGSRWDNDPVFNNFYNPYWVRPLQGETPSHASIVENSAYW